MSEVKLSPEELQSNLAQFYGTEQYHRSSFFAKNIVHTDGIQYLAEKAGAFWLIDAIVSHMSKPKLQRERFHVWTLEVKDSEAVLRCTDGDKGDGPVKLAMQRIPYTDFPLSEITIWVESSSLDGRTPCWVMMLPSER